MTQEEIIEYIEKGIEDDAETDGFGYFVCESQIGNEIIALLKEQAKHIKELEEKLDTLTRWRANAGAFD